MSEIIDGGNILVSLADRALGRVYVHDFWDIMKGISANDIDKTGEIPQSVLDDLAEIKSFALKIPEEYGGRGLSQMNYAKGAMNLTANNTIRYFSSLPLEESIDDDYRFESDFWNPWAEFNPNLYE